MKLISWKEATNTLRLKSIWLISLITTLVFLKLSGVYLMYNETRTNGVQLNDWVLNALPPADVTYILFGITWTCIIAGVLINFFKPITAMYMLWSITIIAIVRSCVMYLVPLLPPEGIIPLKDPLVEYCFYSDLVMQKDLFFSGHTANMVLVSLIMPIKWLQKLLVLATCAVAFLLLKQHVHYTIDVIAAPFFAYLSFFLAKRLSHNLLFPNLSASTLK